MEALQIAADWVLFFVLLVVIIAAAGQVGGNILSTQAIDSVEANITSAALGGITNLSSGTPTWATIIGASILILIVLGAFHLAGGNP